MSDSFASAVDQSGAVVSAATRALFHAWPSSNERTMVLGRLEDAVRRHVLELQGVGITGALAVDATRVAVRHAAETSPGTSHELVDLLMEEVERMLLELSAPGAPRSGTPRH